MKAYVPSIGGKSIDYRFNDREISANEKLDYLSRQKYGSAVDYYTPYNYEEQKRLTDFVSKSILDTSSEENNDRYSIASAMSGVLNKDVRDVLSDYDLYKNMFTGGVDMDDKTFWRALGDSWKSEANNRKIASFMNKFDEAEDESYRDYLMSKIDDLEHYGAVLGDVVDRGFGANVLVSSMPVVRQVLRTALISYGSGLALSAITGVATGTMSMANAMKTFTWANALNTKLASAGKLGKLGAKLVGTVSSPFNVGVTAGRALEAYYGTYQTERGLLSRELYNTTDQYGRRIDEETRKEVATWGGVLIALAEYFTPEPALNRKLGGPKFQEFMGSSARSIILDFAKNSLLGANSEAIEEGLQAVIGEIAKDVAKNASTNAKFERYRLENSIFNYLWTGMQSYIEAFPASLIAGIAGSAFSTGVDITGRAIAIKQDGFKLDANRIKDIAKQTFLEQNDIAVPDEKMKQTIGKYQEVGNGTIINRILYNTKGKALTAEEIASFDAQVSEGRLLPIVNVTISEDENGYVALSGSDEKLAKYLLYTKKLDGMVANIQSEKTIFANGAINDMARAYEDAEVDMVNETITFNSTESMKAFVDDIVIGAVLNEDGSYSIKIEEEDGEVHNFTLRARETKQEGIVTNEKAEESNEVIREMELAEDMELIENNAEEYQDSIENNVVTVEVDGEEYQTYNESALVGQIRRANSAYSREEAQSLASFVTALPIEIQDKMIKRAVEKGAELGKLVLTVDDLRGRVREEVLDDIRRNGKALTITSTGEIVLKDNISSSKDLVHELFHVLWNTFPEYRTKLIKALREDLRTNANALKAFYENHQEELNTSGNRNLNKEIEGVVKTWEDFEALLKSATEEAIEAEMDESSTSAPVYEELFARMAQVILMDPSNEALSNLPTETRSIFRQILDFLKGLYKMFIGENNPKNLEDAIFSIYRDDLAREAFVSEETQEYTSEVLNDFNEDIKIEAQLETEPPINEESINEEIGDQGGISAFRKKYNDSKKAVGLGYTLTLPNGEEIRCHYVVVEADAPTASHNEQTFESTEGFPTNEKGQNVNDRDYKHDEDAQEAVKNIARNYDSRAIANPPVVTKDGIVVSGNNRVMSSKLASKNGTDSAYIESLKRQVEDKGINSSSLDDFKHPRLILEIDDEHEGPYTTKEFAKYNKDDKKTMSKLNKAISIGKQLSIEDAQEIAYNFDNYEVLSDLYKDKNETFRILSKLVEKGVITTTDMPQYLESDGTLSNLGKDLVETLLIGAVLDEDNVRNLDKGGIKSIRNKLVRVIVPLMENKGLDAEYSINEDLNKALNIAIKTVLDKNAKTIEDTLGQLDMFEEQVEYTPEQIYFAKLLTSKKITETGFASTMRSILAQLAESSTGQMDMFFESVPTKAEIVSGALLDDSARFRYSAEIKTAEEQEVYDKYYGTDKWMKAPNGNITNLTEKQWLQVRTPSFKNWFGDWENNPQNASNVVDENGEPLVMYHGTRAIFDYFDTSEDGIERSEYESAWNADYLEGMMFCTSNKDLAEYYGSNIIPLFVRSYSDVISVETDRQATHLIDDGGIAFEPFIVKSEESGTVIAGFNYANNVKHATDNNGAFSTTDNRFRWSEELNPNIDAEIDALTEADIHSNKNATIRIADKTPLVFIKLGFDEDKPLEIRKSKIATGIFVHPSDGKSGHADVLTKEIVKQVLHRIPDPLAVFSSATVNKRVVALYEVFDKNNNPLVAIVSKESKSRNVLDINLITSIYSKENKQAIGKWIKKGLLLYVDDSKLESLRLIAGLRLSTVKNASSNKNVKRKSKIVNSDTDIVARFSKETESLYTAETTEVNPSEFTDKNISDWKELTSDDITNLISASVFIPTKIVEQFSSMPIAKKELEDRATLDRLSADGRIIKLAVGSKTSGEFATKLKNMLKKDSIDGDYSAKWAEWEGVYEKYFTYVHTATPTELKSWFMEKYASKQTTTLEDLLELKKLVGLFRKGVSVKNGVRTYTVDANSSRLYSLLSKLNRNSTNEQVKEVIKKLGNNLSRRNTYLKEYARAMVMAGSKLDLDNGGISPYYSSYLLLSLGEGDDVFIANLRGSDSDARELKEATKDGEKNKVDAKWLDDLDLESRLINKLAREIKKDLGDKKVSKDEFIRMLNEYERKLEEERGDASKWQKRYYVLRRETVRASSWERTLYAEINDLNRQLDSKKRTINMLEASIETRAKAVEKAFSEMKLAKKIAIHETREFYWNKMGQMETDHQLQLMFVRAMYRERIARIQEEQKLRRIMKYNNKTHDAYYMDPVLKYLYKVIHNKEKVFDFISCDDYKKGAVSHGQQLDADGTDFTTYDAYYETDELGNTAPYIYETVVPYNPNAPRIQLDDMPDILQRMLPKEFADRIKSGELVFQDMSSADVNRLRVALLQIKKISSLSKEAKDEVRMQRRRGPAMEIFESQFGALNVGSMDAELKNKILDKMDSADAYSRLKYSDEDIENFIRKHPEVLFSALHEDIETDTSKKLDHLSVMFKKMQRVAEWMDGKEDGPIYNNFFRPLYEAYEKKLSAENARRAQAVDAITNVLSDGNPNNKALIKERNKWLDEEFTVKSNTIDDNTPKTLTGIEMVGVYVYAQNIYGFIKLVSSAGNNINLEDIARINPTYAKKFIKMALQDRLYNEKIVKNEPKIYNDGRMVSSIQGMPLIKDVLRHVGTDELKRIYRMLVLGEISNESILPEFARKLGDTLIDLVGQRSEELIKAGYDEYNMLTILQDRYFPLVSLDSNMFKVAMQNGKARVNHGVLIERQMIDTYKLNLDPLANFYSALENQESLINMASTINDMWWMMSENGGNLKGIINQKFGNAWGKYFEEYLNMMAEGSGTSVSDFGRDVNNFIGNIAISRIGLNLMTSFKQLVSIIPAMTKGELTPMQVLSALGKLTNGTQKDSLKMLIEQEAPSVFYSAYNIEAEKASKYDNTVGIGSAMADVRKTTMWLTTELDGIVKQTVWVAKYEQEVKKGTKHKDAVFKATQLVQTTQSVTDKASLAQLQRNKNPLVRVAYMFTNDLFQMWNLLFGDVKNAWTRGNKKLAIKELFGAVLQASTLAFLAGGWLGGDDDDSPWWEDFLADWAKEISSYIPVAGTFISDAMGGFNSSYYRGVEEVVGLSKMISNQFKYFASDGKRGKDYEVGDWLDKSIDLATEAVLTPVGAPATMVDRASRVVFPKGISKGTTESANSLWYLLGTRYGNAMYPSD